MYHVHAFATPNSVKVPIALEELGIEYTLHAVNVRKGEQKSDAFLALNANGKVPVLTTDDRDFVLTESAAILVYLSEKHGKLLSQNPVRRARTFEQLFVHASGLSPAFGQAGYFLKFAPQPLPHAIERFSGEANRQLKLLDGILAGQSFVAGDEYSIADIAHFGWIWRRAFPALTLDEVPHVQRWDDAMIARPAVTKAIGKLERLANANG
ncbi:glutathione S-transferase N-terminal domain-containing protein [Caballeronia sp. LZ035]|uniref:glutathione S-transferase family protein n=1 Tax=Caballeronia sp. LZ035 TaxID=3038568 RepID=UPI00286630BF|nr:glutathione S-transferase N-terminal domain-containing protein [Caballeronia sp. LZ035]MDR5762912.1 glutathione S-transferase N-terminal domain-containing protein [Caballeronia sp. LZ035]